MRSGYPDRRTWVFNSPFRPGVDALRLNQLNDDPDARRFGEGMRSRR